MIKMAAMCNGVYVNDRSPEKEKGGNCNLNTVKSRSTFTKFEDTHDPSNPITLESEYDPYNKNIWMQFNQ